MAMACEDANSKLVEVVTVVDVDARKLVDDSLVQIWKVKFGNKVNLLFRLWAQGLIKILKVKWNSGDLKFDQYFAADVGLRLWIWI